jgi:hypothetical protein
VAALKAAGLDTLSERDETRRVGLNQKWSAIVADGSSAGAVAMDDRLRARLESRLEVASAGRTARKVGDSPYAQVCSDFLQLLSTGGEKSAEQSPSLESFHQELPVLDPSS